MKKLIFTLLISIISINFVFADTFDYPYTLPDFVTSGQFSESQLTSLIEENKSELINIWQEDYSTQYPYYYLSLDYLSATNDNVNRIDLVLRFTTDYNNYNPSEGVFSYLANSDWGFITKSIWCSSSSSCYYSTPLEVTPTTSNRFPVYQLIENIQPSSTITERYYNPFAFYQSNFEYYYNLSYDTNVINSTNTLYTFTTGDVVPTYSDSNIVPSTYTTINLNDYSYVALSLKNYNLLNDNINQYSVKFYVTGQLCLTPVYNYGMTEKTSSDSTYQIQSCSEPYSVSTPVQVYILKEDIVNHAIYYLKSYNYSIDNIVQVDTSIFNITYITTENASNPNVVINGRSYPTIPYDSLTSSATSSTDIGYVSGRVCAIGDVNCQAETMGMDISDLFTHPLTLLQSVWTSITSVFTIITTFITILPPTLQVFLYTSFMLGIILGIIKIIL